VIAVLQIIGITATILANKLYLDKKYTASDFDYYKNDAMLFEVAPGFFEEKGYSVIEIFKDEELC